MVHRMKRLILLVTLASYGACLSACVSRTPYPDGLHWFRNSAEQKAIYLETYRHAADTVRRMAKDLRADSWGVILDIDETILDNSEYQKRLALSGTTYDPKTWNATLHRL